MRARARRTSVFVVTFLMCVSGIAQFNNTLYFMYGVPQSNRMNPAFQPRCGLYIGFPAFAPLRAEETSSSLAWGDVIYPHPDPQVDSLITFLHPDGDKEAFLDLLAPVNFFGTNLGITLISVGFRTESGFLNLEVTSRWDGHIYYPGDLARLMINGAIENTTYQLDGIGADLSVMDEISLGWSREIRKNLNIGIRAKVLFGVANLSTKNSEMSVYTSQDVWTIKTDMTYNASLPFADVVYDDEDMIDEIIINDNLENPRLNDIAHYAFNTGNLGLGLDVGADFRPIDKLQVSLSLLDLGFVRWNDEVHELNHSMVYDFRGFEVNPFDFSEDLSFGDYMDSTLQQMGDSITGFLNFTEGKSYTKRLNTKIYAGASYHLTPHIGFGILTRTDFLNKKIAEQVTVSANFNTGRILNYTLTWSYMNGNIKNIGSGLSMNFGPVNIYGVYDNFWNLFLWPQEARSVNFWWGINLVFGYKAFKGVEPDRPLIY